MPEKIRRVFLFFVVVGFVFDFTSIHRDGGKRTSRDWVGTTEHMLKFLPLKSARSLSFLI